MNYSNSQTSLIKTPPFGSIITKTPLPRQNRPQERVNDQSMVSQYQSPTLRQAMSPKAARDYLNSLKSFINQYETKPQPETRSIAQSTHDFIYQQPYLYFPLANRLNEEIKLMTPQKIEVKKYNSDGTVHSLRYYYTKQPAIGSLNDVTQSQQIMIIGDKKSGKKKLFQELIKRIMPKFYKLLVQTESGEKSINLQLNDDIKQTIKSLLNGVKHYQLIAQSEQNMIACRGLEGFKREKKDRGVLVLCIKPGKETKQDCIKTLKLLEEIQKI